jgi:hypothetical protein
VAHATAQAEALTSAIPRYIERIEEHPQLLWSLFETSLMDVCFRCANDPRAALGETWEAVTLAMQSGSAIFAAALSDGPTECQIGADTFRIPATGARSWTTAETWITTFWLATICREKDRLDMLADVPASLLRASGAEYDEFIYSWVDALKMFWRRDQGYFDQITAAMGGTDPATLNAPEELVLLTWFPQMKVFSYLVQGEADSFNDALAESVELHRTYWADDPYRSKRPEGYICLASTALAALAVELDVPVDVESDYLPKHLIQRTWIGEFPT